MDGHRVSAIAKRLTDRLSRRAALRRFGAGAGLAAVVGGARRRPVAAQDATPAVGSGPAGYVVIRRYRLRPGASYDELVRRVQEGFVPIIDQVPGFVEYLFVDPGNGGHIAVSVFEDQAGADASTERAGGWSEQNVTDLVHLPAEEVIGGQVRLHAVAGASSMGTPAP